MAAEDIVSFFQEMNAIPRKGGETIFFRGHEKFEYKNLPRVFRQWGWESAEEELLRGIVSLHPEEFFNDSSTLDKLVRAQHHGLPTRLLDVTLNPLVALYFCCSKEQSYDGEVVVFSFENDRVKTFDSDTVSIVSNTALLRHSEKKSIHEMVRKHFGNEERMSTSAFNDRSPLPRLLHFIQAEKPYFKPKILPQAFRQFIAVIAKRNNRRMIAQAGAFIAFAANNELKNGTSPKVEIFRIRIPAEAKPRILGELDQLNINLESLFPDITSASKYLADKHDFDF